MTFRMVHNNINVFDLEKSVTFYKTALGMKEVGHQVELTWLRDRKEPYNLGDNEIHMAVAADDLEAARAFHRELGCICYENPSMGIYFISDPDGYWTEVVPAK